MNGKGDLVAGPCFSEEQIPSWVQAGMSLICGSSRGDLQAHPEPNKCLEICRPNGSNGAVFRPDSNDGSWLIGQKGGARCPEGDEARRSSADWEGSPVTSVRNGKII